MIVSYVVLAYSFPSMKVLCDMAMTSNRVEERYEGKISHVKLLRHKIKIKYLHVPDK